VAKEYNSAAGCFQKLEVGIATLFVIPVVVGLLLALDGVVLAVAIAVVAFIGTAILFSLVHQRRRR
jgi:hypothetical protein